MQNIQDILFTPHGFCLLWEPALIITFTLDDLGIAIAYFSIALALGMIAYKRSDLFFKQIFWLFVAFITLCGITHILDVITLWLPIYNLFAVMKTLTAVVSITTAIILWSFFTEMISIPSLEKLKEINEQLRLANEKLTIERDRAERIYKELEKIIIDRQIEIHKSIQDMQIQKQKKRGFWFFNRKSKNVKIDPIVS